MLGIWICPDDLGKCFLLLWGGVASAQGGGAWFTAADWSSLL